MTDPTSLLTQRPPPATPEHEQRYYLVPINASDPFDVKGMVARGEMTQETLDRLNALARVDWSKP